MKRLTMKDENGFYLTGDGIYSDWGMPEKFRGDDVDRLAAIEDILGDEYDLERLRALVELYKNVPHICDYCIGCEIEPTDGHGCDGYDNFVFSVRRIVAALKAREQDGNTE